MARRASEEGLDPDPVDEATATAPPGPSFEGAQPSSLLVNSGAMLTARAYGILVTGALTIYAIRTLSTAEYGRYAIALAFVAIFQLFSEMGISSLALREMSQRPERERQTLAVALGAEALTSVVAVGLLLPIALALGYPGEVLLLLAVGAGTIFFQGLLSPIETSFRARRVFDGSLVPALQSTVTALVGFPLIASGGGAAGLMLATLAGAAVAVPAGLALLQRRLRLRPAFEGARGAIVPFLRSASPIALTGAAWILYERIDVLLLSKLAGLEAVALYNVPLTIVHYALLVPAIVGTTFFPLLSAALKQDVGSARAPLVLMARVFVFFSIPLAIGLVVGGEDLLTLVFGGRYAASALPMAILSATIVLGFLSLLGWYALLGAHQERRMVVVIVAGLVANVALNLVLIPAYGVSGAATSLVLSEAFIVGSEVVLIRRHLFALPLGRLVLKPALAGLAVIPLAILLAPVSQLLSALVAAPAYMAVLLAMRYIRREEWEPVTRPLGEGLRRVGRRSARSSDARR